MNKYAKELLFLIKTLHPKYWFRNEPLNKMWDKEIRRQLNNPKFSNFREYTVTFNGLEIWIKNYPYCFCHDANRLVEGMPSRRTVLWFSEAYHQALFSWNLK